MQSIEELKTLKIELLNTIVQKKQLIEKLEDMIADPDLRAGRAERKQRRILQRQVDKLFNRLAKANLEVRNIKYGKQARSERKAQANA